MSFKQFTLTFLTQAHTHTHTHMHNKTHIYSYKMYIQSLFKSFIQMSNVMQFEINSTGIEI